MTRRFAPPVAAAFVIFAAIYLTVSASSGDVDGHAITVAVVGGLICAVVAALVTLVMWKLGQRVRKGE